MNLINLLRTQIRTLFETFIPSAVLTDLLVVVVMVLFWLVLGLIITKIVKFIVLRTQKFEEKQSAHGKTIRRLINNLIRTLFFFWIAIMVLQEVGIDIMPILAGAGVVAFAIGFGAQEVIKDFIAGFFLILERTFTIGDYVVIGDYSGHIIDVGLIRTKLKNWKGEVITINNGDIKAVLNASINPSVAVIEFKTDYATDSRIFETEDFVNFAQKFAEDHEEVIGDANPVVITNLSNGAVTFRITFETNNRKHIGVEREFMKALKEYTIDNNIDLEIPLVLEHLK